MLQYDHVVVHSRGGQTSFDNLVVTASYKSNAPTLI
jgi:hypothetical protein